MIDRQSNEYLEEAVMVAFGSRHRKLQVWSDSHSQFRTFSEDTVPQTTFFRIVEVPTHYRYSQDMHQRIRQALSGYFIEAEVTRYEQNFEGTTFLLKGDCNYISLSNFIKIKSAVEEDTDPHFVIHILNFLVSLISVLVNESIQTELSTSTICLQGQIIKLCDYHLFFLPANKKSTDSQLKQHYLEAAAKIVYSLISGQQETQKIERCQYEDLVSKLKEKEPYKSNQFLFSVVSELLLNNNVDQKQIRALILKMNYQSGATMTDSNITYREDRIESLEALAKKLTMTSSFLSVKPKQKKKIKRTRKIMFSIFCSMLILAAVAICLYLFVFTETACKANEFMKNHRCYPCFEGCKTCDGSENNQCTKCWGTLWLVKLDNEQKTGSCQKQCIGQPYEGRECIIIRKESLTRQ